MVAGAKAEAEVARRAQKRAENFMVRGVRVRIDEFYNTGIIIKILLSQSVAGLLKESVLLPHVIIIIPYTDFLRALVPSQKSHTQPLLLH